MAPKPTSIGTPEHVAVALAYVLGWVSGLIILLIEKENETVRYHAAQSVIVFGSITLLNIVLPMLFFIGGMALMGLLSLATLVLWIVFIVTALNKNPLVLDFLVPHAEKLAEKIKP